MTLSSFGPRGLYDAKYGTMSPPSMDRLYTLGVAASIEADESELSCHSHSHSPRLTPSCLPLQEFVGCSHFFCLGHDAIAEIKTAREKEAEDLQEIER